VVANLDDPVTLQSLPVSGSTLFYFAPPPGGGNLDSRMRNFCASMTPDALPKKIIYLSTSGVYGDCGEMTVTEETPPNPMTARAKRRLDAETVVAGWGRVHGVPVIILRVTGIYGPGRLPMQHIMNGTPLLSEEDAPVTNRIHADDLARVCVAAAEKGEDGDIFNVSDGEHSTMTRYFNAVADLLGIEHPPVVSREEAAATMPPLLYSYFSESRRIDNSLMLKKLGFALSYPTLAQGLPSCKPSS
jgi:nucleoside-diphosphate-sugar epimerase